MNVYDDAEKLLSLTVKVQGLARAKRRWPLEFSCQVGINMANVGYQYCISSVQQGNAK